MTINTQGIVTPEQMFKIALRRYDLDGFQCEDRLYRINADAYRIHETCKGHPDEPSETWREVTLTQACQWLSECPEQFVWSLRASM